MKNLMLCVVILLLSGGVLFSQDAGAAQNDEAPNFDDPFADPFADPFSVPSEASETPAFDDPFAAPGEDIAAPAEDSGTAASDDPFANPDSLFQGDMVEEIDTETQNTAPQNDLLEQAGVTWGGRYSGKLEAGLEWTTLWTPDAVWDDPENRTFTPTADALLFFNARPNANFRVFGELTIETDSNGTLNFSNIFTGGGGGAGGGDTTLDGTWVDNGDGTTTFQASDTPADDQETTADAPYEPGTGSNPGLTLTVTELFSDFNWDNRIFFRFGKQTIAWGEGYFWSPADVLNLSTVDPENPAADREGPVAVRTYVPWGLNGLYLYLVANSGIRPSEVAVAPKFEFTIGGNDFALAAYYQRALAPRVMGMFSATILDIDVFGEAVVEFGSDRVFVRPSQKTPADFEDPPEELVTVLDTFVRDGLGMPFFQGTIGFMYRDSYDAFDFNIAGQYYFNGEGYADSSLLASAAFLQQNSDYNGLAVSSTQDQPAGYVAPPSLNYSDLQNWGRHYAALSVSVANILESDIGVSSFVIANLADLSGICSTTFTWLLFDRFELAAGARFTFGQPGDEYTNSGYWSDREQVGTTLTLNFGLSMGGGTF